MPKPGPAAPAATPGGGLLRRWWGSRTPEQQILIWMCVLIAVNQAGFGSVVAVVALYAGTFGVSQAAIGLTITIYGLARFLVNVPAGRLADSHGRRWVMALGGIVSVGGNLLCGLAPDYTIFVVGRFIAGAGAALVLVGGQIVLADIATPQNRGRVMGTYQGVFSTAVGIGPMVGGLLATSLGLGAPFFAYSIAAGAVSLLAWFIVPETRGWRGQAERSRPQVTTDAAAAARPRWRGWAGALRGQTGFLLVSLVSFATFFARTGALFGVVPLVGSVRLGLQPDQIGLALGLAQVFGFFLAYPSGWLADRFGRKIVIVPSTVLSALALAAFALAPSYGWFLGAALVWALSVGLSSSAPAAYVVDLAPSGSAASLLGSYRMIADFGYVIGPVLLGFVGDVYGSDSALVGTGALLLASTVLFALFAPETHRPDRPPAPRAR